MVIKNIKDIEYISNMFSSIANIPTNLRFKVILNETDYDAFRLVMLRGSIKNEIVQVSAINKLIVRTSNGLDFEIVKRILPKEVKDESNET